MKRTLLMVMAVALLLTQCRKPEVKFPTPSATEGVTVSMTVTAGPGSKTNIDADGRITWSSGDKLYVGDGSKCIGCLTLTSGADTPTGTFSGDVTLTGISEGIPQTFHFFYLGSNPPAVTSGASSVEVSFAEQTGLRENLGSCHVGYGSANGTVTNGVVTGINVTLVSKVALARFSFTKDAAAYMDVLTLSGTNIYNSMTVGFGGSFNHGATSGSISLTGGHGERYVMLVPTGATTAQTLTFTGSAESGTGAVPGLESNKFYGKTGPIVVSLTASQPTSIGTFTVSSGVTVSFSPGNLYWDGSAFRFESKQWETTPTAVNQTGSSGTWSSSHVSHFFWSKTASVAYAQDYSDDGASTSDVFFTNATETTANHDFHVNGETGTNQWRTLSKGEWDYLLNTSGGSSGRTYANRFAKAKVNGVCGLLIFPDEYDLPSGYTTAGGGTGMAKVNKTSASDAPWPTEDIPTDTWTGMETAGVVFLPAAGFRTGTDWYFVGSYGNYWSSTQSDSDYSYGLYVHEFMTGKVGTDRTYRSAGYAVRLVRSAS